jgi:hypothetical protein
MQIIDRFGQQNLCELNQAFWPAVFFLMEFQANKQVTISRFTDDKCLASCNQGPMLAVRQLPKAAGQQFPFKFDSDRFGRIVTRS